MAEIKIGGVVRKTAPMTFKNWKKAWAAFERIRNGDSAETDAMDEMVLFLSCALASSDNPKDRLMIEEIDGLITMPEINSVKTAMPAILEENGFGVGEASAAAESGQKTSSTETLTV